MQNEKRECTECGSEQVEYRMHEEQYTNQLIEKLTCLDCGEIQSEA